ncbi:MAG: HlyD family secretion protein [Chitinophagaceae bacterium]
MEAIEKQTTEPVTVPAETAPPVKKKNYKFLIGFIIMLIAGGVFGYTKYQHSLKHEDTDDAQIDGNISLVIPRVSGYVTDVRVKDNQFVKKGDTLLVLDDRDLKIKLEQAEAALEIAQSNLGVAQSATSTSQTSVAAAQTGILVADAQIDAAKIKVKRTADDYERYANLIKDHSITQQQYDQALAEKETAEKQLIILQEQRKTTVAQTNVAASQSKTTGTQTGVANATIHQKVADVDAAKLNLSYAVITAPTDGIVSKVTMQTGQYIQQGQSLFNVVLSNDVWVVANFKETQFDKMRIGQKVVITADAFPGHEFEATLTSFSPATGSRFALLPPDNASGNFVKTVQRLPVKIEFSNATDSLVKQLRPGMNVGVDVHLN